MENSKNTCFVIRVVNFEEDEYKDMVKFKALTLDYNVAKAYFEKVVKATKKYFAKFHNSDIEDIKLVYNEDREKNTITTTLEDTYEMQVILEKVECKLPSNINDFLSADVISYEYKDDYCNEESSILGVSFDKELTKKIYEKGIKQGKKDVTFDKEYDALEKVGNSTIIDSFEYWLRIRKIKMKIIR